LHDEPPLDGFEPFFFRRGGMSLRPVKARSGASRRAVLHPEILSSHGEMKSCCSAAEFFIMKSDRSHCEMKKTSR